MAEIIKMATAGTDEKSDVVVTVEPCENGLQLQIKSVVMNQFGAAIEASVRKVLEDLKVENAVVAAGKDMETLTMPELDAIWDSIKHRA